jgi:hypothetical protein
MKPVDYSPICCLGSLQLLNMEIVLDSLQKDFKKLVWRRTKQKENISMNNIVSYLIDVTEHVMYFPFAILVDIFENTPIDNQNVVVYERVKHAAHSYGTDAERE